MNKTQDPRPVAVITGVSSGISPSGPLLMQPEEEMRTFFDVNVFRMLAVTRAFLRALGARRGSTGPKIAPWTRPLFKMLGVNAK
ncbi:hypothetical protein [Ralstonia sp.]|uniref:hypothetical protein n=1 Tax=Ralstonia sp. TaxID=54061 RepID=UPI0031DFC2DF